MNFLPISILWFSSVIHNCSIHIVVSEHFNWSNRKKVERNDEPKMKSSTTNLKSYVVRSGKSSLEKAQE